MFVCVWRGRKKKETAAGYFLEEKTTEYEGGENSLGAVVGEEKKGSSGLHPSAG